MVKLAVFLIVALVIEAVGVVWLSHGLKQIGDMRQFSIPEAWRLFTRGVSNPYLLIGTGMEAVFFLMLLTLLKHHDVSLIWPLTALGFVLTALAARFIRHEQVSALRWGGVILIVIGAALVAWSERNKNAATGSPSSPAEAAPAPPSALHPRG